MLFKILKTYSSQTNCRMSVANLKEIFLKAVQAVQTDVLVKNQVQVSPGHLSVRGQNYPLNKPCYLVGFGKAVLGMALTLETILEDQLKMGIVNVPEGILKKSHKKSRITFIEGAKDNIPDENALRGSLKIKNLVEKLSGDDLLIVLVSGGGSALLPLPIPPIKLMEKQDLIKKLSSRGADIMELNCVRKQMSVLKGGGLAELAYPCRVISLILSDVVGDPLDYIASGPTTPNLDKIQDAIEIIQKYGLYETLPNSIKSVLTDERKHSGNTTIVINGKYEHVENFVIGNNHIAAEAARQHAISLGFQSAIISTSITGNVSEISQIYATLARDVASAMAEPSLRATLRSRLQKYKQYFDSTCFFEVLDFDLSKMICLIAAGEPTVVVVGDGKGGRNQQLALEFSLEINKLNVKSVDISFLSGGTDGIDGPTDAAGAIGTWDLVNNSLKQNIKPQEYLNRSDSYGFYTKYQNGNYLLKIGHTGTNVMDIHLIVLAPII